MTEKTKNILSFNHKEAMDFFLKSEQYHGFELPEYFVFDELLQEVKNTVGKTPYKDCLRKGISPEELPDVNLDILLNKDGHYAVRPIILANPFISLRSTTFRILHLAHCPLYLKKKSHFTSPLLYSTGGVLWNSGV